MNVSCPSCGARYRIDDSKITGRGARVTCPKCSHRFEVRPATHAPPAMAPAAAMEDEDDAPTTIMQHSSEMMEDLRRMATAGESPAPAVAAPAAETKPAPAKPAPAPAKPASEEKGGSKAGLVVLLLLAAGAAAAWGLGLF